MSETKRRLLIGNVLSSRMDKTIIVQVGRKFPHPIYKKYVTKFKKYYVHDPGNIAKTGDQVRIIEARPISKLKRWRLLDVARKAEIIE